MPVGPERVAALFLVALAVIAVPGPSVLFVVSRGVALGRPRHWRIDAGSPARSRSRLLGQGFVVGVSNPKTFLLFAAILPQFTDPAAGRVPLQMLFLGLVCVVVALATDSVWALLSGAARDWLRRYPRGVEAIGAGAGAVMVGLGVRLAVGGRSD